MRPQKVSEEEILISLTKVFRAKGYEGASLQDLAAATGLKKASLYHRFPEGKKEMAEAVLQYINDWVDLHVFKPLDDTNDTPTQRLTKALSGIRQLYDGGKETCLFRALSMQASLALFEQQIVAGLHTWRTKFASLASAFGFDSDKASQLGLETLIAIQGSLIVAKGLNDITVFEQTLTKIENSFITD
ncbi:TetR/AcrR family transcriptional regulator [Flavobacterium sp. ASW18X]|uniref:TetR/AcrR family transcriptional regulator n=1 Tax=Flavobacterium sp. ASW18X TaxID=2572595 RepID=UPI0010AE4CB4|nr:TetR/AcrR family transcriptional regulator [Flavobacterium sp. ASW18X]TKD67022.1 TetR/AcrR family transcriptional regulator [Flavobacterium sp. ASW18X]